MGLSQAELIPALRTPQRRALKIRTSSNTSTLSLVRPTAGALSGAAYLGIGPMIALRIEVIGRRERVVAKKNRSPSGLEKSLSGDQFFGFKIDPRVNNVFGDKD